jgi:hypothetical protein
MREINRVTERKREGMKEGGEMRDEEKKENPVVSYLERKK